MNSFDFIIEAITPGLASLNDRCRAFDFSMNELVQIDWKTGNIEIANKERIERVFEELYHSTDAARKATLSFVEKASLGMAVLTSGDNNHSPVGIPWHSLIDLPSLMLMTSAGWGVIGIQPWMSTQMARTVLSNQFPNVPANLLEPDHLEGLVKFSRRKSWLNMTYRMQNMPNENPPTPPGSVPGGPGPSPVPWGDPQVSYNNYRALADCLGNAQYTFTFTGVTMCLDRPCADLLQQVLLDQAVSTGIWDLITGNIFFATTSGFSLVSGWLGAAIETFRLFWAAMIAAYKNNNGVCLTHYYPWMALPGWANGR